MPIAEVREAMGYLKSSSRWMLLVRKRAIIIPVVSPSNSIRICRRRSIFSELCCDTLIR